MPMSQGQYRYIAAAGADGATPSALAAGRQAAVTPVEARQPIGLGEVQALRLRFFGTGSDNGTFAFTIKADLGRRRINGEPIDSEIVTLGTGTATLGTNLGNAGAGALVGASERFADQIAWTPSAFLTLMEQFYEEGESALGLHSPGDNTVALLTLPCLARAQAVYLEFSSLSSVTAANAIVECLSA